MKYKYASKQYPHDVMVEVMNEGGKIKRMLESVWMRDVQKYTEIEIRVTQLFTHQRKTGLIDNV